MIPILDTPPNYTTTTTTKLDYAREVLSVMSGSGVAFAGEGHRLAGVLLPGFRVSHEFVSLFQLGKCQNEIHQKIIVSSKRNGL